MQIVTQVGDSARPKIAIAKKGLVKKDGRSVYELEIENNGERWIIPEVSLELFDAQGARLGLFHGSKQRIYPGTSIRQDLDLPGLKPGVYKGVIVIDGGGEDVFGARTEIEL